MKPEAKKNAPVQSEPKIPPGFRRVTDGGPVTALEWIQKNGHWCAEPLGTYKDPEGLIRYASGPYKDPNVAQAVHDIVQHAAEVAGLTIEEHEGDRIIHLHDLREEVVAAIEALNAHDPPPVVSVLTTRVVRGDEGYKWSVMEGPYSVATSGMEHFENEDDAQTQADLVRNVLQQQRSQHHGNEQR